MCTISSDARVWMDKQGREFEGDLLRVEGQFAYIQRDADRRVFQVEIQNLSLHDQVYLRELAFEEQKESEQVDWGPWAIRFALFAIILSLLITMVGRGFDLHPWSFWRSVVWQIPNFILIFVMIFTAAEVYGLVHGITGFYDFGPIITDFFSHPPAYLVVIPGFFLLVIPNCMFLRIKYWKCFGFLIVWLLLISATQLMVEGIIWGGNWVIGQF
ncbi:MAG: hypothetical protein AAFX93_09585 [Verrucomicrobiota bacterium]